MSGKGMKKLALLVSVIMIAMIAMPAASVSAIAKKDYIALGDSISFGYTDPVSGGYADMYAGYLGDGFIYTNLSSPGDTTQDLLSVIRANRTLLRRGDVFTISIGSNHLLGPFISAVAGLYDIDTTSFTDPTCADLMAVLAGKIKTDWTDGGTTPDQRVALLSDLSKPECQELNTALLAGKLLYNIQWPLIMSQIRLLAPGATIYVNNLYNPLLSSKLSSSALGSMYTMLDAYMRSINTKISLYASRYNYKVVNVYKLFADPAKYANMAVNPLTAPVTFNIPAALTIAGPSFNPSDPAQAMLFFLACDPHPSTVGHTLIFNKLKSL